MATEITQLEIDGRIRLRVEGEMLLADAELIEKLVDSISNEGEKPIIVDLADLDFLDSESAQILRKLETEERIEIVGIEIFLQTVVNSVERIS
ncbi:MAG: STAS domain-containing protein [Pyrinomonadaceae bacterium]